MTRVLLVTNDFPPRPGGIEQFLGSVLACLPPDGLRVIASRFEGDREHDASLPYRVDRTLRSRLLPTPLLLRRVRTAAEEHAAEVVVFGASWPLGELGGSLDLPTFAFTYGHEAGLAQCGLGPLLRRVARNVDGMGVISDFTRHAIEPWVAEHTQIFELPPGVDTDVFHPDVEAGWVRSRYGLDVDEPLVVCISRLVRRKGQDALVEAWPAVRAQIPDARLLLVGDGGLEPHLRRRIGALGLGSSVLTAGRVPWSELPAHYAAADLFAAPCRTRLGGLDVEGLGIVYLEAQACGTPVVAGRSGGAPEALVDGRTGVVVDGGSVPAVAATIGRLLRDRDQLRAMGAAGRALVERRHTWRNVAERVTEIVEKLAFERRAARP